MSSISSQIFTSNGSWVAPPGITLVLLQGFGGGGAGGDITGDLAGGGGANQCTQFIPVIPGVTYTIVIGAGGTAPSGNGGSTTFSQGATLLASFIGASGNSSNFGGSDNTVRLPSISDPLSPSQGGANATSGSISRTNGFTGGAAGATTGGGGAGPNGNGGAGGTTIGSSAAANTGAGGGGGTTTGGAGGSGQLQLYWWNGMASAPFLGTNTTNAITGSWQCPPGYAGAVLAIGCGAGGSGGTGVGSNKAGGGGAELQYSVFQGIPGGSYTVNVPGKSFNVNGQSTTITDPFGNQVFGAIGGGLSASGTIGSTFPSTIGQNAQDVGSGGGTNINGNTGYINTFAGGAATTTTGGGGAGPYGTPTAGVDAPRASGAGGCGGFKGGSGQVTLYWWPGSSCEVFTSSGRTHAKAGSQRVVMLYGFGGGGGGGSGSPNNGGGGGGGGSVASIVMSAVGPFDSNTVTIGAGGTGGAGGGSNTGFNGTPGGQSSFSANLGGATWLGGQGGAQGSGGNSNGGASDTSHIIGALYGTGSVNTDLSYVRPGWGGISAYNEGTSGNHAASANWQGWAGGSGGTDNGQNYGGGGGGGGPNGVGGAGGNGSATTGSAGGNASANSGAGGGGSGGGGTTNLIGGNGGSGMVVVVFWP